MDEAIGKERDREETGRRGRKKERGWLTRGSRFPRLRSIPPPSLASLASLSAPRGPPARSSLFLGLVLLFPLLPSPADRRSPPSRPLLSFYSAIPLSPFDPLEKTLFPRFALSRLHLAASFTPRARAPLLSLYFSVPTANTQPRLVYY